MLEINWNPSRRELRQFATIWLPAFATLGGLVLVWRAEAWTLALVLWSVAAASLAIGLTSPDRARPLFVGAILAAYPIGWVVSHLVLAIIYYGLFTLIGLLMRLVGYDPLTRERSSSLPSYWAEHEQRREPGAYFRQF